jgi:hypothetical protein
MLKNYKNKQIAESENKGEELLEEYHFSGGLEYEPLTVKARSREEAEEIWRQKRIKIKVEQNKLSE